MKKCVFIICLAAVLIGCSDAGNDPTSLESDESPSVWTEESYSIEELVLMFQDWIPDQYLNGQVVWVCNTYWEDYKVIEPDSIKPGMHFDPCHDQVRYIHPAIYMHNVVKTIRDTAFFTKEFLDPYPEVTMSGDTFWSSRASLWLEGMVVNYSEQKCARMLNDLATKYINDDKMASPWAQEKERWLAELKKIEEKPD